MRCQEKQYGKAVDPVDFDAGKGLLSQPKYVPTESKDAPLRATREEGRGPADVQELLSY